MAILQVKGMKGEEHTCRGGNLIENKDKKGKDRGVFLRGFGSFIIKDRAPKVARNITEGTSIDIPAHCIPAFKPSKSFVAQIKNETMKVSKK